MSVPTLAPVDMPNDTPPEFENVSAVALTDDAPAETLNAEMRPAVDGTVYDADMPPAPLLPKLIPFAFWNVTVPDV